MDIAASLASQARVRTLQARAHAISGLKVLGSEILKQIRGKGVGSLADKSPQQVADAAKTADEFSNAAYIETRAKVQAIYDEHRAKRIKEEQAKQDAKQEEVKKIEELNEKRIEHTAVTAAVGKSSAETGRGWGAE